MKKLSPALLFLLLVATLKAAEEPKLSPLPIAVSNNAVAMTHARKESKFFSFMGIGPKKTWNDITSRAFQMELSTGKWTEVRAVPGVAGRLAASAAALRDQIILMGGYVVDGQGGETTVSDVNVFVPDDNRWYRRLSRTFYLSGGRMVEDRAHAQGSGI